MSKRQFAIYPSIYEAAKFLTDEELGRAMRAVMTYHFAEEEYQRPEEGSPLFEMFLTTTLPLSDSQKKNTGGAPVGNQNARKQQVETTSETTSETTTKTRKRREIEER